MIEIVKREDFDILIDTNCTGIGSEFKRTKSYEKDIEKFIRDNVSGHVFIDVGAHVGIFSVIASVYGAKYVHSIEPDANNYKLLRCNKIINDIDNMFTYNFVASDKDLGVYKVIRHDTNTGDSRMEEVGINNCDSDKNVVSYRIDEFFAFGDVKSPVMVKIDTQGMEFDVIAGMTNLPWDCVIAEINSDYESLCKKIDSLYNNENLEFSKLNRDTMIIYR